MPVYVREVSTKAPIFKGREITVASSAGSSTIPVPDSVVLCDGCNENIAAIEDGRGFLIYLSKADLRANRPYDFYCRSCLKKYFPKVTLVDTYSSSVV